MTAVLERVGVESQPRKKGTSVSTELLTEKRALKGLLDEIDLVNAQIDVIYRDKNGKKKSVDILTDAEMRRIEQLLDQAEDIDKRVGVQADRVKRVEMVGDARAVVARANPEDRSTSQVSVTGEPSVYGSESPNSFWRDQFIIARGPLEPSYNSATQRSAVWGHQVEREIATGSSFGKHAESELRESFRDREPIVAKSAIEEIRDRGRYDLVSKESRATGTGGGPTVTATTGASSFVTPVFVGPAVAYRQYGRAFADQCAKPDMPDYGMAIYKPVVTGPAGFGAFAEAPPASAGVTEVDPTVGYLAGTLGIYAGQVTLSQAVLDRTAPNFRYDLMVEDQIMRQEAPILDNYVIAKALANANIVGYNSTFVVGSTSGVSNSLQGHVSQAKAIMRKTQGTVLNPTHVWFDPARWEVVEGWGDANGRPVAVPSYAGPFNALAAGSATGDAGIEGNTTYRFAGLPAYTDPNLPTTNGTLGYDQVLVANMQEIEFYEGTAYNRVLPQTYGNVLQTLVQRYKYVTTIVNYPSAVQAIQGSAFVAPNWGS